MELFGRDGAMLLTGFESYGGRSANPAEEIVKALDGEEVGGERVVGRILRRILLAIHLQRQIK